MAVVIAIAGIVQAKTIKEIEKDLKEKKNEWTKMQKENPGCVLEDNSKQQQAIVKRAGVKGHRNYFGSTANRRKSLCAAATRPNTAGRLGAPRCRAGTPPLPSRMRQGALQVISL